MQYPKIIHHGAVEGVTGSCHQLALDAALSLLIDCGLFQGEEAATQDRLNPEGASFENVVASIKALVITHVHADHVGRLPELLAAGFKGPILCSEPSALLLPVVLEDAFSIQYSHDGALVERYLKQIAERVIALRSRAAACAPAVALSTTSKPCSVTRGIMSYSWVIRPKARPAPRFKSMGRKAVMSSLIESVTTFMRESRHWADILHTPISRVW